MGIDSAPYQANLFLYFFESRYVTQVISKGSPRAYKLYGTSRFIDDLCTTNDDGEFSSSYKYIYPKQLELKLKHRGEHANFLDLDIPIEDNVFVFKLFDKRDNFPFFIVRTPYLSSNIPLSMFYDSIFSEFLRIARITLKLTDFVPKAFQLDTTMVTQGRNKESTPRQIKKHSKDTLRHSPSILRHMTK